MSYYARQWMQWTDRLVVVVAVACLVVGLMATAQAQGLSDDQRLEREPGVVQTPFPPARLPVIWPDGTLAFDYGGTVAWSRFMVSETAPQGRIVWVLTWIHGPGGLRPLWLPGVEAVQPRADR